MRLAPLAVVVLALAATALGGEAERVERAIVAEQLRDPLRDLADEAERRADLERGVLAPRGVPAHLVHLEIDRRALDREVERRREGQRFEREALRALAEARQRGEDTRGAEAKLRSHAARQELQALQRGIQRGLAPARPSARVPTRGSRAPVRLRSR